MLHASRKLDEGFAAMFAVLVLGLSTLAIGVIALSIELAYWEQKTQLLADQAALIASETTRGLIGGFGCDNAFEFARRFDVELDTCRIVGFGASIEVSKSISFFRLTATATAGP
ncbi:MAG: hypothetical protein RL068_842 [Actinomycetota bacterium]|jgi:hypothetical protein